MSFYVKSNIIIAFCRYGVNTQLFLWYICVRNNLCFCIDFFYDIQYESCIKYPTYFKDLFFVKRTQKLNQLPIHEMFIKQKSLPHLNDIYS